MPTKTNLSLTDHTTCPYSRLAITTKPEWQDIKVGTDYSMSYGIIGENILFTCPRGNIRTVNIEQAMAARDLVLLDHFGTRDPLITEIRDFGHVHGVPSHQTRTLFRKSFATQQNQKAMFVINMSWIIRAVFVAGLRLHNTPFPLKLNHSYHAALSGALDLLSNKVQTCQTEWCTQTDSIKVVHIIINNCIIFTQSSGNLVKEDIPKLLANYEELLLSKELQEGPIYRIADYTGTTKGDWKGRLLLIQGLNKLHETHNRIPEAVAFYGLNTTLHTTLRLVSKILKYPVYLADNETEAFSYIYKKQQGQKTADLNTQKNSADVEDILHFISTIIWDDPEETIQTDFTDQPLAPISEALLLVKQDVSDLLKEAKEQTEEITEKNRLLEAEIRHRNKIEKRLTTAIEQAEAANKAKGDFLATMSHEIRTPMNGILGMFHLLENTNLSDEQRGFLNISNDSATSLLRLINEILDFSKVDQGQLQMEVTPFDLKELCSTCCTLFNRDIQEKSLELHCKIDQKLKQYSIGDPGKLRQILINLLSNAIKFTPSGSIKLRAEIKEQSPVLATIKFSVTDTGIGISPDKLDSIFDTFSQADSSTTRQYGGTGLGLAISRKICEFMEGKLDVQSKVNEGTTFSFTLPFGLGDNLAKDKSTKIQHSPIPSPHQNFRILIVEDEPVNQMFVEALLDQFGYQHDHAGNGLLAIEALKQNIYHIILMDCQMPVMDGYEATAKIRSMQFKKGAPTIIALTAHAMEGDRERCLECGMDEYISKPIVPSLLLETIEKHHQKKDPK